MPRERLPNHRTNQTDAFDHDGTGVTMTQGFYPDGRLGEVFLNATPTNSMIDALLSDVGTILSFALQYGATIEEIAPALKRDRFGLASSHIGAAIDRICPPERV